MAEELEIIPAFGWHEGFYPKINHFKKLVDNVIKNPKLFQSQKAKSILNENNVNSLKLWGLAFNLIREENKSVFVANLGKNIFSDDCGTDPYLEEKVTICLLNDVLFINPCRVPSWYFFFYEFKQLEFTKDELLQSLSIWVKNSFPQVKVPQKAIKKDVECIIKMYTENIPDNPFLDLGAILDMGDYYKSDTRIWI
jgi:hypothetical protein